MTKQRKINPYPGSRVCLTSPEGEITTYKPNAWIENERVKFEIMKRQEREREKQDRKEG